MNRRDSLRALLAGAALAPRGGTAEASGSGAADSATRFSSKWHLLPDMPWTGEDLWAQRLQDWCVKDGELHCLAHGEDRTVNVLTHQLGDAGGAFTAQAVFRFLNRSDTAQARQGYAAFRLGLKGRFDDYRSAIFTGTGINAGLTRGGRLFIADRFSDAQVSEAALRGKLLLSLSVSAGSPVRLTLKDEAGRLLGQLESGAIDPTAWRGVLALASHFKPEAGAADQPTLAVERFSIEGEALDFRPQQTFGPIYFAQYTRHAGLLKLTAQLAPLDRPGAEAQLEIREGAAWTVIATSRIHPLARTASFRVASWKRAGDWPYRVSYRLPLGNGAVRHYSYEGVIAAEPTDKPRIKALAFSCNWDIGFPDNEVVANASRHDADLVFFLGDQFYEANGRFGVQVAPLEKSTLDYLRKWLMFGWSYRELFRSRPMVALPDDHDVYHGNVWGSGGRAASAQGNTAERQDSGGYKMPAEWVNMAQLTQTSHMPDPWDARPVMQGIGVYYNQWNYAGISFAIIEDRKFKSAPQDVLPPQARVYNGYAQNPAYEPDAVKSLQAQLIGERQLQFLSDWLRPPRKPAEFRVLVSATPLCCLQTLPAGTMSDDITGSLPIPAAGEYVAGDAPTRDMDSNGWPHNRRDEVVRLLGKHIDLHLVGDQHMPSVVEYGADEFRDGAYCFAVPALGNIWPRRWWPPVDKTHQPLPGGKPFTGNFKDGFDNKITVHAAVSPHRTGRQPALLYDRVTGYGVVEFDKASRQIVVHCWPRFANPADPSARQYEGWPVTIGAPA